MKNFKCAFLCLALTVVFFSCDRKQINSENVNREQMNSGLSTATVNTGSFNYVITIFPAYFNTGRNQNTVINADNTPEANQITNAGAALGRVLFYDKNLSQNGTVSCASCHQQAHGFSDPEIVSNGFEGGHTRRHSMSLTNARFYAPGRFFWDERAATLEDQVLMPIQDPVEMGLSLNELEEKVGSIDYYPTLFQEAFGSSTVSSQRISQALAQFVRSLVSYQSKYYAGRALVNNPNVNFPNFTAEENQGKRLFFNRIDQGGLDCVRCHETDAFIGRANGPTNNGLDAQSTTDLGVFETTGNRGDIGRFKSPSLRNIEVTAPYMHDGRFQTLAEVIEHYNSGIQNHRNLDNALRGPDGQPVRFNLSDAQKSAMEAFLLTLTDQTFLEDEKFGDPFE